MSSFLHILPTPYTLVPVSSAFSHAHEVKPSFVEGYLFTTRLHDTCIAWLVRKRIT